MAEPLDLKGYDFSGRGGIKEVRFDGEPVDRADPSAPRTAADFLATAAAAVTGPRAAAHGDKHVTFANIARLFEAWLACKAEALGPGGGFRPQINARDVAVFNMFQKLCRDLSGDFNPDDWTDLCGYAACGGEVASAAFSGTATRAADGSNG